MATRRRLEFEAPGSGWLDLAAKSHLEVLAGGRFADVVPGPVPAPPPVPALALGLLRYHRPDDFAPRDWAVFLLNSAAEVEHALLIQYLFAAFSLRADDSPINGCDVAEWQGLVLGIAREEMGHLLTVQNLLRLLGSPLCLAREDFPLRSQFYPFPFVLERISKDSLAKYVFAEMTPGDIPANVLDPAERAEVEARAKQAVGNKGGSFVNHVGTLYDSIIDVVQQLPAGAFRTDRADWQSLNWSGTNADPATIAGVKLLVANTRDDAIAALRCISQQGEAASQAGSHFARFLKVYKACPQDASRLTWPVARNPTINADARQATLITDPLTLLWAELFNLRYRILLYALAHAASIPEQATGRDGSRLRPILRTWVYGEMTPTAGSLSSLAMQRLVHLRVGVGPEPTAGPPFDLPYTLALSDLEPERWGMHLDLITASAQVGTALTAVIGQDDLVDAILVRDETRRNQIGAVQP